MNTSMKVDTGDLRQTAMRLHSVQGRLNAINAKLRQAMRLADMTEMMPLALADLHTGFDQEIRQCMHYLDRAADRLEHCEEYLTRIALALRLEEV